jgi:hypothetical protein
LNKRCFNVSLKLLSNLIMPHKDLHEDPFDEGAIARLEIFEDYAQAWIPTFVMQGIPTIYIRPFAKTQSQKNRLGNCWWRKRKKTKTYGFRLGFGYPAAMRKI